MKDPDFDAVVALIIKEDPRFDKRAYNFLRLALDQTVKELRKKDAGRAGKSFHVTGPELLEGLRVYALEQYGPLTKTVLNEWGLKRCRDFGDMVFNLIDHGIFSKSSSDQREDFSDIYTFEEAFVRPFQPKRRQQQGPAAAGSLSPA